MYHFELPPRILLDVIIIQWAILLIMVHYAPKKNCNNTSIINHLGIKIVLIKKFVCSFFLEKHANYQLIFSKVWNKKVAKVFNFFKKYQQHLMTKIKTCFHSATQLNMLNKVSQIAYIFHNYFRKWKMFIDRILIKWSTK